jgi:hypothetical protein
MLHFAIGITIILCVLLFVFFLRYRKTTPTTDTAPPIKSGSPEIDSKDIVLARLQSEQEISYGILWNGPQGNTYHYKITFDEGTEVAQGEISHLNKGPGIAVYKLKGLPLVEGTLYQVEVGDTKLNVEFNPLDIQNMAVKGKELQIHTSGMPTDVEILINNSKIPLNNCGITPEPPGVICDVSGMALEKSSNIVAMVYNGKNVVTIHTT